MRSAEGGKYHHLQQSLQPVVYLLLLQFEGDGCVFVVRSRRTPSEIVAALERVLSGLASNVSITVRSWSDSVDDQLFPARVAHNSTGSYGPTSRNAGDRRTFGMAA